MPAILGSLIIAGITAGELSPFAIGGTTGLAVGGVGLSPVLIGNVALLAGSVALNYALIQTPKQQKPADGLLSIRQPNPVRQGGYGRMRVAGSYMFFERGDGAAFEISSDVLALISGRICGFSQFFLNEDAPTLSGITIQSMPDGRYFGSSVHVNWRIGLPVETYYSETVSDCPTKWASTFRGDGIASMILRCQQAPTITDQTFYYPQGKPEPSAECDLYAIWDPRDPNQDPDDPDTWVSYGVWNPSTNYVPGDRVIDQVYASSANPAWSSGTTYARYAVVNSGSLDWYSRVSGNIGNTPGSNIAKWIPFGAPFIARFANINTRPGGSPDKWISPLQNPVLQLIDYLTNNDHGMGLDRNLLITPVLSSLMTKANLCDTLVTEKSGQNYPLYTSNGKFNFDDDPADVLGQIGASCDMWWCEDEGGALALEIGVYSIPTVTIKPKHILAFSINYGIADEQVVNELTLTFTDPANKYKEVAGDPWRDETDISSRGKLRSQSLSLKWVHRHAQARRIAKRAMARLSAPHGTVTTTLYGKIALGKRWINIAYPFLPEMGTEASPVVVELSKGTVDYTKGTVTFEWMLVDPLTIDAWDPASEEGTAPLVVA